MMLAMALAHRQHATRSGGGWRGVGRREGRARPPGLCTLLAAIALFLVLVGSATLGVERLVDALENTRSDRLPAYNSAATSWRFGGSAAFANKTRGLELRVNGAPTPLVPRNGTERFSEISAVVPAEISDARDDVVRVRSTHVLYASIPRTTDTDNNTDFNSILVPPGVLVTFVVGYSNHNHAGAAPPNVGPAGVDGRGVAFAPFACAVWSHSLVSARDRVDCDACVEVQTRASADASARCKAACDEPKSGRRFVARRAWVKHAELVVEEETFGGGSPGSETSEVKPQKTLPLRVPTDEGCALRYHTDAVSRAEWETAEAVRAFCASPEGATPPTPDAAESSSISSRISSLPLAVTVRSSRDPRVVAGALTKCSYDFGPSAREHASAASFLLLLSFACVLAATYWSRGQKPLCFPNARLAREDAFPAARTLGHRGHRAELPPRGARNFDAHAMGGGASRNEDEGEGGEGHRAYYVTGDREARGRADDREESSRAERDRRRRDRRRDRDAAARLLELAETRISGDSRGRARDASSAV